MILPVRFSGRSIHPHIPMAYTSYRRCPLRSGTEALAFCTLATGPGTFTYEELASALGTTFAPGARPRPAREVGRLFGIGKQRTLSIQSKAEQKLRALLDSDRTASGHAEAARRALADLIPFLNIA